MSLDIPCQTFTEGQVKINVKSRHFQWQYASITCSTMYALRTFFFFLVFLAQLRLFAVHELF